MLGAALVALLAACGGGAPAAAQAPAPDATRQAAAPAALAPFAGQPVVVTPAQRLQAAELPAWSAAAGEPAALLARVDSAVTAALAARGPDQWSSPERVVRTARRNPTLGVNPYRLGVEPLLATKAPEQLGEPIASQLRSIVALDGQRYVVVPAAVRFVRRPDGRGEGVLVVAVVDARLSRRLALVEVRGDPSDAYDPALAGQLATRLLDLVSPPQ